MNSTYAVYQTQPDGTAERSYWGLSQQEAQSEVDRINSHLADRGIPSSVSCAYVG
jgi:hypothetical protein